MEEKEIIRKYENLTLDSRGLTEKINDIWVEKEKLRSEYRSLTGKDISERYKTK